MSRKVKVARDTLKYAVSTFVVQGLNFFSGIYIRRTLGPEAMGVWALLQVFLSYAGYTNLGLFRAVYREIPVLRGRGELEKIEHLKDTAFTYVNAVSFLTSLLFVAGAFLFHGRLSETVFYGLLALAVINFLQRASNFLVSILYTEKRFGFTSSFQMLTTGVGVLLTVALVPVFRLYGIYLATALSLALGVVYLAWAGRLRFGFRWNRAEIAGLLGFGTQLALISGITTFFQTADRVFLAKWLGLKAVGIYTIATMAGGYILMIPNVFNLVIFPSAMEHFGDGESGSQREDFPMKSARIMSVYLSLCLAAAWLSAPVLCAAWLPEYTAGLPALNALVLGYCFLALVQPMGHILLGYRRQAVLIPLMTTLTALIFPSFWLAWKFGGGILSVAAITAAFFFLRYFFVCLFTLSPSKGWAGALRQLALTAGPILWSATVLALLDDVWPRPSIALTALKAGLFAAAWFSYAAFSERYTGVWRMIAETWRLWRTKKKGKVIITGQEIGEG